MKLKTIAIAAFAFVAMAAMNGTSAFAQENGNRDENGKVVLSYDKKMTDLICPKCSKALEETKYSYRCECGFNIWHTTHQKKIPKTDMVKVLKGEWSSLIKGFVSRNGKTFDASVKWNDTENKYEFEFPKKSI